MDISVRGLVIRTTDVKESDRIITIFTEELGVISAMAIGARSLKSRKMSSTMQFCYSSFILTKRGEYYRIKEAELIESFFGIRNTIEGLALAGYIAEEYRLPLCEMMPNNREQLIKSLQKAGVI